MDTEYITATKLREIVPVPARRVATSSGGASRDRRSRDRDEEDGSEDPTIESPVPVIPRGTPSPLGDDDLSAADDDPPYLTGKTELGEAAVLFMTEVEDAAAAARLADQRQRWVILGVWAVAAMALGFALLVTACGYR
jgi:hypothetical protein